MSMWFWVRSNEKIMQICIEIKKMMLMDGDGYGCSTTPPPSLVYLVVSSLMHQNLIHHLMSKLKPAQIRHGKTRNKLQYGNKRDRKFVFLKL
jgi:hypothetical protein